MTEPRPAPPSAAKEDPETLVLRARPRPAVRFRRGLIAGLSGVLAASVIALSWAALDPSGVRGAVDRSGIAEARDVRSDALEGMPRTYGDVPRLGPPLPGDLGRPILEHQRALEPDDGGALAPPASPPAIALPEPRRQADEERAAAIRSPVLVPRPGEAGPKPPADAPSAAAATGPVSPWTLSAGTIIPASLITGLNSDLPGPVLAQVTEDVRDSATGRTTLVPQGARLLGRYDSTIAYGQQRAMVVWERILFPSGASVVLGEVPATDAEGSAGLRDRVDAHGWHLVKGVVLSTLLGVGTQLGLGRSESDLVRAVRESGQQNAAEAGDRLVGKALDIEPTLTVRPGWPVRAILSKDLVLEPWRA